MFFNATITEDGVGTVTFFLDGSPRTVTSAEFPVGYPRLVGALVAGTDLTADDVDDLLRPEEVKITKLDERVSLDNETGTLSFDGEPIHSTLATTIVRYFKEGRPTVGLVKFLENLNANPSRRSREQLFSWTERQKLVITDDGHFIGYKGVAFDHKSKSSGTALVNGVSVTGNIPNEVGHVISMDRRDVQDDPNVSCSHGLHVGDYAYAKSWAPVLLEVKVNPKNVVSVPTHETQKLRCCEYEVVAIHEPETPDDVDDRYTPESDPELAYDPYEDDDFELETDFVTPLREKGVPKGFLARLKSALGIKAAPDDDDDDCGCNDDEPEDDDEDDECFYCGGRDFVCDCEDDDDA